MDKDIKNTVRFIINECNKNGLKWKDNKDIKHLDKRKLKGHIPNDFTLKDYENIIMDILNNKENDVFIFGFQRYDKVYLTFASRSLNWLVIIGENAIMETAYYIKNEYEAHLSIKRGYTYIGKLKEVLDGE